MALLRGDPPIAELADLEKTAVRRLGMKAFARLLMQDLPFEEAFLLPLGAALPAGRRPAAVPARRADPPRHAGRGHRRRGLPAGRDGPGAALRPGPRPTAAARARPRAPAASTATGASSRWRSPGRAASWTTPRPGRRPAGACARVAVSRPAGTPARTYQASAAVLNTRCSSPVQPAPRSPTVRTREQHQRPAAEHHPGHGQPRQVLADTPRDGERREHQRDVPGPGRDDVHAVGDARADPGHPAVHGKATITVVITPDRTASAGPRRPRPGRPTSIAPRRPPGPGR